MALTIYDLSDLLDVQLSLTRYPNQDGRWAAHFDGFQIRENESIVSGAYGQGKTPDEAIADYAKIIRGQRIETIRRENRQFFIVPKTLTN